MHSTLPTKCNCNLIKSNWIIESQYYSKSSKRAAAQMSNEAMQGLAMRCITSTNMLHFCHRLVWSSHITQHTCCRAFPVAAVHLLLRLLKCQDYSAAITQLRGNFTKFMSKTVAQLNSDVCWQSEWTVPSQPYDWRKRLRLGLPLECQESWWQTVRVCAAANGKALSPRVARRVDGTCSVVVSAERWQWRVTIADVSHRLLDRYAGGPVEQSAKARFCRHYKCSNVTQDASISPLPPV